MKVLTFSRHYPKGHNKQGQPTWFVEKVWKSIWDSYEGANNPLYPYWQIYDEVFPLQGDFEENIHQHQPKHHTIRAGNRFKVGDMASLRVWSGKPYRSPQTEFAQVEVKKVWDFKLRPIKIHDAREVRVYGFINNILVTDPVAKQIANNDGLTIEDFDSWFCPEGTKYILNVPIFEGQIICWDESINY